MLGSIGEAIGEAEDAVQETWLRLGRVDAREVDNLSGWLRTVVSRVCLDMLRSRAARFLAAARGGDLGALLAVRDPDVVRRADPVTVPAGTATVVRGARAVAEETVLLRERARHAATALVDGTVGLVVAPRGRLLIALTLTVEDERITAYEVIADPGRLRRLELAVLER